MKKSRILTAAALLALPSMLISSPGYSTSSLPEIGAQAGFYQQQSCPNGNQGGCFMSASGFGPAGMVGVALSNADRFRRERIDTCLQFMQRIRTFAAESG